MKLRGFKKGLTYGTLAMGAFLLFLRLYLSSRGEAPRTTPITVIADMLIALSAGLICGLLALLMRRFGRPRD